MKSPEAIVDGMMEKDRFSQWLGIEVLEVRAGYSKLQMSIKEEMLNGFDICHGGILFSLADSAFAFASNAQGRMALALDANINFTVSATKGMKVTAICDEQNLTNRTGVYRVRIADDSDQLIALFHGTVYRTSKAYEEE